MRKHLYFFVLCTLSLCTFFGCKNDSAKEPETLVSNVSKPSWTIPADYDYNSSMTAVVKVDLAAQYPETAKDFVLKDEDLLAAFSGETCLGTASPEEGLFFLYITEAEGEVTLRYYSAHYKNLFVAKEAFSFQNDVNLGTIAEPFTPAFVVEK